MRPLKLKMSAFCSYSEPTVLDLDRLGDRGIYLITGDTGAGKTTIFDAITFALYGKASGDMREPGMLRSKYADPSEPTEVELTFVYNGKEYRVRRNPEYERPKTRGDGFTKQPAGAELIFPDGKILTKISDVDKAIIEIMGIDRNQFTQIAMIAQGEFQKLIKASTDERKKIYQKIFCTENYFRLQEALKIETKQLHDECDQLEKGIRQYIDDMEVPDDSVLKPDAEKAKEGQLPTEDVEKLLKTLIEQDEKAEASSEERKKLLRKERDDINVILTKAESYKKSEESLRKNTELLKAENENLVILLENSKKAAEQKPEAEKINNTVAELNAALPKYQELSAQISERGKIALQIENFTEKEAQLEQEKISLAEKISELKKELKGLETAGAEKEALLAKKDKLEVLTKNYSGLSKMLDELDILNKEREKLQKLYEEKSSERKNKTELYGKMHQAYLDDMAGILSENLTEGDPCPVCGSTVHPCIAKKAEKAPSKAELDKAEAEADKATEYAEKAARNAGDAKIKAESKSTQILEKSKELLSCDHFDDTEFMLKEAEKKTGNEYQAVLDKLTEITEKTTRKAAIEEILPKKEEELTALVSDIQKSKETVAAGKTRLEETDKQIENLRASLPFGSASEITGKISELKKKKAAIEKAAEAAENAVNECRTKIAAYNAAIEEANKALADKTETDTEKEKIRLSEIETAIGETETAIKNTVSRLTHNRNILTGIESKSQEIKPLEEKYSWVKSLSGTANGSISGKEKIMLETYIQMTYFDRIIERANVRLLTMTSGQYELVRRREADNRSSQSGLELDVIDHYNGSQREANSLSGGESFKASLCLALGLSEEIQCSAGGIRLDSMFVDEGFGSLDDSSLELLMRALSDLSEGNRLVGIISHVAELSSRIDKKITVTKTKSGGSKAEITL